ncbi:MAG: phosphotransferase family protein [Rhizomicrobium sp.]
MSDTLTAQERVDITAALTSMMLLGESGTFAASRLSGGVSCDVYRVELGEKTICLKRALPKLRVAADWRAPAERSMSEVAWMKLATRVVPGCVPEILGEDRARHMFAMEYFPPETYPVWKSQLASGQADAQFAARVGSTIAHIHAATAGRSGIAEAFANDTQFHALRLEPYLLYTAARHLDVAPQIRALADGIAAARIALMHGDVSPKNILCGPNGPVFLDAETACYGDPAFDLAFCLNHLLLKCVWHPQWTDAYLRSFTALKNAYLDAVDWEARRAIDARTARLLPALLLARIDGKSPVEYLTAERKRNFVRRAAKTLLASDPATLDFVATHWANAVGEL